MWQPEGVEYRRNPNVNINEKQTWSDIRDLSAYRKRNNNTVEIMQIPKKSAIVEATGFARNSKGEIELVALENTPLATKQISECSGANTSQVIIREPKVISNTSPAHGRGFK